MSTAPKVLIHGAGSIGICYAYILQKAGCDVTTVCRSNYATAKENGFTLHSPIFGQDLHFHPTIVSSIAEAASHGPYDYVLVTTKAFPPVHPCASPAATSLAPALTPNHTVLVLIQNGIGIEAEYALAHPSTPLLSCVVYLPATQTSPATVEAGNIALLQIGAYPATPTPPAHALRLAELLRAAGAQAETYPDVQERRWRKLVLNCGWNPVCALSRSRDVAVLGAAGEAEGFVKAVMLEVAAVARAVGYAAVDHGVVEKQLERARERLGTEGIEPSMLADVREGRRMEVEAIVGNTMRLGKEMGVEVVRLEVLYVLIKALDDRIAEQRK